MAAAKASKLQGQCVSNLSATAPVAVLPETATATASELAAGGQLKS